MSTIKVLSPEGQLGEIPEENLSAALQRGFQKAVAVTTPEGDQGYIPQKSVGDAVNRKFIFGHAPSALKTAAKPSAPQLSPDEEMPVSQAEQDSVGPSQTVKELGSAVLAGLAGGAAAGPIAAATPEAVATLEAAAKAHPFIAGVVKTAVGTAAGAKIAHVMKLGSLLGDN
jgi:hypothetical protein